MVHTRIPVELLRQLLRLALLFTLTSAWMLMAIALLRAGLGDSARNQLSSWIFLCLAIWLPIYAAAKAKEYWVEAGAIALTVGAIFPLLGLFLNETATFVALALLSMIAVYFLRNTSKTDSYRFWKIVGGSILLALVLLSVGSADRFFLPEEITLGTAHSDAYFHLALSNMLAKFLVPTIGADGLEFVRYHFGSHIVAAGMSNTSGARVSEVYVYWGAVNLRLQFLWGILWCSLSLLPQHSYPFQIRARLLVLMSFTCLTTSLFNSESFLLASGILIGVMPLLANYVTVVGGSIYRHYWQLLIILGIAFICAATKVSVGYFVAVVLIYACCVNFKDWKRWVITITGLCALAIATVVLFSPLDVAISKAKFNIILSSYLQLATLTTLLSIILPIAILAVQLVTLRQLSYSTHTQKKIFHISFVSFKVNNFSDFFKIQRSQAGGSQILFISLLACIVVAFTMPIGSNLGYFSAVLLVMSIALIPIGFYRTVSTLKHFSLVKLLGFGLAATITVHFLTSGFQFVTQMLKIAACVGCNPEAQTNTSQPVALEVRPKHRLLNSLREHRTLWTTTQSLINSSQWHVLIQSIEQFAGNQPGTVVFVPPSNELFWTRLKRVNPYWCLIPQLMIPAQAGVPMLRGISPVQLEQECSSTGMIWYGFGKQQDSHRTSEFNDHELCELAVSKGFSRIFVLNSIYDKEQNIKLLCPRVN
jgi:hypothetical protein